MQSTESVAALSRKNLPSLAGLFAVPANGHISNLLKLVLDNACNACYTFIKIEFIHTQHARTSQRKRTNEQNHT